MAAVRLVTLEISSSSELVSFGDAASLLAPSASDWLDVET